MELSDPKIKKFLIFFPKQIPILSKKLLATFQDQPQKFFPEINFSYFF